MDVNGVGIGSFMQQATQSAPAVERQTQNQTQQTGLRGDSTRRDLQTALVEEERQKATQVERERQTQRTQDEEESKAVENRRLEAIARREGLLENVVARSQDGDTLQVEEENADNSNEGIGGVVSRGNAATVVPGREDIEAPEVNDQQIQEEMRLKESERRLEMEEEAEERAIELSEERQRLLEETQEEEQVFETQDRERILADEEQDQINEESVAEEETEAQAQQTSSNFVGISDNRLEQMYRDGEISQSAYQKEIEAREAEREQRAEESNGFERRMNTVEQVGRDSNRMSEAIETATSDNANDTTLSAKQRLDIVENLQRTNVDESKRKEEERVIWQAQFLE